jgi:hypothetical protein
MVFLRGPEGDDASPRCTARTAQLAGTPGFLRCSPSLPSTGMPDCFFAACCKISGSQGVF